MKSSTMSPVLLSYSNFEYRRGEPDLAFPLGMRQAEDFHCSDQFFSGAEGARFDLYSPVEIREDADKIQQV